MAVFPEQMNRLDVSDTAGSLKRIENYINYMVERMEFATSNTTKAFNETGTTNASVIKIVLGLTDTVALVNANMNIVTNNVTQLGASMKNMQDTVDALQATVNSLKSDVENLKSRLEKLEGGTEA